MVITRGAVIGAEHYGTGDIPCIHTIDLVNWEISEEPRKRVSEEIYARYRRSQDLREKDILLVNAGAFLIGRTVMLTRRDLQSVVQSHCRILRVTNPEQLDPPYRFPLLNGRLAKRQFAAKTFVQAAIATLGNRLLEVALPFSRGQQERKGIAAEVAAIIADRTKIRERVRSLLESSP